MDARRSSRSTLAAAWIVVLLTSALPKVILQESFGQTVQLSQQTMMSLGVLLLALLASLAWPSVGGIRPFLAVILVLVGSQWLVYEQIDRLPSYRTWLGDDSFNVWMLAEQSLNLMVASVVIAALLMMGKRRQEFYLARGRTDAPVTPIPWLGAEQGEHWHRFGGRLTVFISLGTLAFLVIAGRPSLDIANRALPFLPAVLLAAASNAFYEEVTYKASLLSVLVGPVDSRQAVYMVAVFFGLAHFYGVPYGMIGVILAGFLGWILARSMVDTHGMFWAWFIHFSQDVLIFSFLAIGSVTPGGV